jgi:hypothetical protein
MAGALLMLAAPRAGAQPLQIPRPTGYVNDFAGIIDAQSEAAITRIADEVRAKSGGEIVVVTLPSLQGRTRDEVGLQILREWGIGKRAQGVGDSTANTGALLLVAVRERQVRIELGYGTNTFITAAEAGRIRDEVILPAFRQGQFGPGIEGGGHRAALRGPLRLPAHGRRAGRAAAPRHAHDAGSRRVQPRLHHHDADLRLPLLPRARRRGRREAAKRVRRARHHPLPHRRRVGRRRIRRGGWMGGRRLRWVRRRRRRRGWRGRRMVNPTAERH